jgi:hypothetical protein
MTMARWEVPATVAMLAAVAVIVGLVAGLAGYKLGSQPQTPTVIVVPSSTAVPTKP